MLDAIPLVAKELMLVAEDARPRTDEVSAVVLVDPSTIVDPSLNPVEVPPITDVESAKDVVVTLALERSVFTVEPAPLTNVVVLWAIVSVYPATVVVELA